MNDGNFVKRKVEAGQVSVGAFLNLAAPMAGEACIAAGYEWAVVDAEHGAWDLSSTTATFTAIEARGGIPMARVWDHAKETIARILDAGSLGIVLPHVATVEQAEALVDACRYPPLGHRSVGSSRATLMNDSYRGRWANDNIMVIPQIEDPLGVANAAAIAKVEGIDCMFIGPNDLALEMGLASDQAFVHPDHLAALTTILEAARSAGKPAGISVRDAKTANPFIEQGFTFINMGNDFRLLQAACARELAALRT